MARNIPLFVAFRLLFNARFYYPVFAMVQLDYGLTMSQFALLNTIWAGSIVLLEVPSGAIADRIGRKRMVVLASFLMVVEIGLVAFVPLGNSTLVFWVWALNRVISGAAEAAASGADEALAYDSLPKEEAEQRWPGILARLMVLTSFSFVAAMLIGSAVYDVELVNRILAVFGLAEPLPRDLVIRFPFFLTLLSAFGAVGVAVSMREPPQETACGGECSVWSNVFAAGRWILHTPMVFALIAAALVHDSVVRLFLTMSSEYYRLIEIPVAAFGVVGAAFAALGVFAPRLAQFLMARNRLVVNYLVVSFLTLTGLLLLAMAWPRYGVGVIVLFAFSFGLLNFFTSHYLNAAVDSKHRATVLSFKGLALNLGFGVVSLLYAGLLRHLKDSGAGDDAFASSLFWLPGTFVVMFLALAAYCYRAVYRKR